MNRNLDGTELSRDQLIELALEAGMSPEKVTRDVKTWVFAFESRHLRHDMWAAGQLRLGYTPFVPKPVKVEVDWEVVNWLRRTEAVPA